MWVAISDSNVIAVYGAGSPSAPPDGATLEERAEDDPQVVAFLGGKPGSLGGTIAQAKTKINELWKSAELGTFAWNDRVWQCNADSQRRLVGKVVGLGLKFEEPITWKDADDNLVSLQAEELRALLLAAADHCEACFATAQARKAEVNSIAANATLTEAERITAIQDYIAQLT